MQKFRWIFGVVLVALIGGPMSLLGQKETEFPAHVTVGPEMEESRLSHVLGIVPWENDVFFTLRVRNSGTPQIEFLLDRHSKDLEKLSTEKLDISPRRDKRKLEEMIAFGDGPVLFSSKDDYRLKRYGLYYQRIEPTSMDLSPVELVKEIPLVNRQDKSDFSFRLSPDSSKLMVYYDLPFQRSEKERFGYLVYDSDMKLLEDREIKLPYNDELFKIDQYKIDNEGNAYVSGVLYNDKVQEKRKGKVNFQYLILAYKKADPTVRQYVVKLEDRFITDMQFAINERNDLVCSGFFSEKGTSSIIGMFYMVVNGETGKVTQTAQKEFKADFLSNFMSEKQVAKGRELYRFQLNDLRLTNSGRTLLLAEQYFVTTQNYSSPDRFGQMFNRSSFTYHFKNIIVVSINAAGEVEWAQDIPKIQVTTDDGGTFSSYAYIERDGHLWLLFNDDSRNASKDDNRIYRFSNESNSVLTQVHINPEGNWNKEQLFSFRDFGQHTQARYSELLGNGKWVVFGTKGRKKRFALVDPIPLDTAAPE